MTVLDVLLRLHDDRAASTNVVDRLTESALVDLARTALSRLQARVDPRFSEEAQSFAAVLRLLAEYVALPDGEPATTLRILLWFRVADVPTAPCPNGDEPHDLLARAEEAFAEMDWDRTRELVSHALCAPELNRDSVLHGIRLLVCVHHNRGEFEAELAILESIIVRLPDLLPLDRSEMLLLRGNALSELRQFDRARECYVVARRLAKNVNPPPSAHISNLLVNSANTFLECHRLRLQPAHWRRARRDYRRAYKLLSNGSVQSSNSGGLRADRLINIANTYAREARLTVDPNEQQALLNKSARITRFALYCNRNLPSHESKRREAYISGTLANVYERMANNGNSTYLVQARRVHEQALALADDARSGPDVPWNARLAYAEFCIRWRKWSTARRLLGEAHALSERVRRRRELREGRVGLSRENRRIYRAFVDLELGSSGTRDPHLSRVFRWIETAKARTLLDGFAGMVTAGRYHAGVASPIGLDDLRRRLPERSCVVEYFEGNTGFVALVITRDDARVFEIAAPTAEITQQIEELRVRLSERQAAKGCIQGLEMLGQTLVEPLLAHLPELPRLLILVPDGVLYGLPFHALRIDNQHLVERFSILYAPSASVFVRAARRAAQLHSVPLVGVGVSDVSAWYHRDIPALPGAEEEISRVAVAWRQHGWPVLHEFVGAAATCEQVLAAMQQAGTIHFACHAQTNASNPDESCLLLSDGPLTVGVLRRGPRLRAAQVVLSACSSGMDIVDPGDEHVGLVTTFLQAGAGSVLGTLWSVVDDEAPRFIASYYSELQACRNSADALRQAQVKWLSTADANDPSWLWAAFFLAGASIGTGAPTSSTDRARPVRVRRTHIGRRKHTNSASGASKEGEGE